MSIVALYGDEKVPKKGNFMGRSVLGVSGIARNAAVVKSPRNDCFGRGRARRISGWTSALTAVGERRHPRLQWVDHRP